MGSQVDKSPTETGYRSACTECARRKQKCNREWPCDHCQKRQVADKCRFKEANQSAPGHAARDDVKNRQPEDVVSSDSDSSDSDLDGDGFETLGYMPSHVLYSLTAQDKVVRSMSREYLKDPDTFCPLQRALQMIPSRLYTDILVQNFLDNVNFHYYIIHPPSFLEQYRQWWTYRSEGNPLSIQWTCLLLMVCACASQYTDANLKRKLEVGLGSTIQRLTEQYHEAARELSNTIPVGYNHLTNVQQLIHSCYWFKSEARFVECWHVLNVAIREAQEISMHQENNAEPLTPLELEIRRRVWCILDTWDWQISILFGRPIIIDRADCDVGLPNLEIEAAQHSPLTHMKMQSSLIQQLYGQFGLTKNVVNAADVQKYQAIIEAWIQSFPPRFDVRNPDKSLDESYPWIVLHRNYIRTMAYSMLLDPIRAYLPKTFAPDAPEAELKIRNDGISYCLDLMASLGEFFAYVYPRDAKYHWVLFCIFDTSTVLCSAVLHDEHNTLPRREDVLDAIGEAHAMLQRLQMVTKSAKAPYSILTRIVQRLPKTTESPAADGVGPAPKKTRVAKTHVSIRTVSSGHSAPVSSTPQITVSSTSFTPTQTTVSEDVSQTPSLSCIGSNAYKTHDIEEWQPELLHQDGRNGSTVGSELANKAPVFADISDEELGELASLWDYQSLDFSFIDL